MNTMTTQDGSTAQNALRLIESLDAGERLSEAEFLTLVRSCSDEVRAYARDRAVAKRAAVYGHDVYIRGLIEVSNICRNNCYYCGIRRDNSNIQRYRLTKEEILSCCAEGYRLGFRTFVLQGGEDPFYTDDALCDIVHAIRTTYPDCAITLSLGERGEPDETGDIRKETVEGFRRLYEAGANRYLLRHETADEAHYERLHPAEMKLKHRMVCLRTLKDIGFQTGCGIMVGSPYQTEAALAKDLVFIQDFQPEMCGIGPFLPHHDTPFKDEKKGPLELTLFLLSLVRLIKPNILLPATTALGTLHPDGREMGILAGCNVVMPNLSPVTQRKKYMLYDDKIGTDAEAAEGLSLLRARMEEIGYHVVNARGDIR